MAWNMVDATRRWLAGRDKVKQRFDGSAQQRAMAPWDENAYFQTVLETGFIGPAATFQIANADPMRVALIFSLASGTATTISTKPDSPATSGLLLNSTVPQFVITQREYGNLCQAEWFGVLGPGINITVMEVRLREWPP